MGLVRIVLVLACIGGASSACSNADECKGECYVKMNTAGCNAMLMKISSALEAQNITSFCTLAENHRQCVDETFPMCDQNLNKTEFTGGMGSTYSQLCQGSPVDKCRVKIAVCGQGMAAMGKEPQPGPEMCNTLKTYLDCVKEKTKTCDPSVKLTMLTGPMQASFDMQCNAGGAGYCPAISICLGALMGSPGAKPSDSDQGVPKASEIIKQCGAMTTMMGCLNTELKKCDATSPRKYNFADMTNLYKAGCQKMESNSDVLNCKQFTTCMDTFNFPSDPSKLAKVTTDPQLWCSMMKSVMECGSKSPECNSGSSDFSAFLNDVNEVCPEAEILVTAVGSGNSISPGSLTVLAVSIAAFLSRHF